MGKKYKTKKDPETGLLRIIALKDFSDVKKGDEGGLIEKENNLSQKGECWVYKDAKVCEYARVYRNAKVCGKACVSDCASVYGKAIVSENAKVCGISEVYGCARVYENAIISKEAEICGAAEIFGNAQVRGASVTEGAWVSGNAQVCRRTMVSGAAEISGNAKIWSTNGAYIHDTSMDNSKDYVMLTTRDRKIAFIIISGMIDDITFTTTALDYITNIKTIRQLYGEKI